MAEVLGGAEAPLFSPESSSRIISVTVSVAIALTGAILLIICIFQLIFSLVFSWITPSTELDIPGDRKDVVLPGKRKEGIESSTVARDRKRAYPRQKEVGLRTYLNIVLRVPFTVFGLLTIILSVVFDNFYNDQPIRFIPFGILAPFTIVFGFLASGWFPRIPLRFIAYLKRHGFLRHVMPCSPWHDNVLTDFSGLICTLKPMEQDEGTSQLPRLLQNFLDGGPLCSQGPVITQSTLDSQSQDLSIQDSEDMSGNSKYPSIVMTTGQVSLPNFQEAPSQVEETIIQIDHSSSTGQLGNSRRWKNCEGHRQTLKIDFDTGESSQVILCMFCVSDNECKLTFNGPMIYGFTLDVQAIKNMSLTDTFELSYIFRNKKTEKMYLNARRLRKLAQNMFQWVKNPHPIVVEESSGILHCMPIRDILWEFTKSLYTLKSVQVKHRFIGFLGWEEVKQFATISYIAVTSLSGLIPLISEKRSLWFLFLLAPIVVYMFISVTGHLICYYVKSLLCPLFIKVYTFNKLYKCRSFFTWCNEFRKQRVVNPEIFLISQDYSNSFFDRERCFEVTGSVELSNIPTRNKSPITLTCRQEHAIYKLIVKFDTIKEGSYIDVSLSFYENDDLLDTKYFYGHATEIRRLRLVEKLFNYYSNPSFGGYVETIRPSFWSYLAHCPRFLDVCVKIIRDDTIPILLVATRKPDCKFIIGDSFLSASP